MTSMSNRKQASYSKPKETQQQPSEVCISFSGCIPRPHVSRYYLAKQRHAAAQGKKIQAYVLRLSFISPRGEKSTSTYVNCAIQELLPTAAPSHGRAGQVLLPAFECIAAQLDSALATSGKKSEVLAFDLKLPFILPAKKPESRGESKWNFVFVKSVATSMTLWDTWQQIDTRSQKPGRAGLQEQTEQWQWLSYYSHLSMKPLSRARSPWWSMSLPFENASPQDQIVSRISDNTTKTSARALRTHHTNTYILTCVFPLSVHIADFCY